MVHAETEEEVNTMALEEECSCDLGELMLQLHEIIKISTELQFFELISGTKLRPKDSHQAWGANVELAKQELTKLGKICTNTPENYPLIHQHELLGEIDKALTAYNYKKAANFTEDLIFNLRANKFVPK